MLSDILQPTAPCLRYTVGGTAENYICICILGKKKKKTFALTGAQGSVAEKSTQLSDINKTRATVERLILLTKKITKG